METNSSTVGTKYTNSAITEEKARTLARKNPALGNFIANTFGVPVTTSDTSENKEMDRYTRNAIQTLFSTEIKNEERLSKTLNAVASDINGIKKEAVHEIQGVKEGLNKLLQPVSSVTGTTLGTLTNIAKDPMGAPFVIGDALTSVVDKVNPDLANKMDATFKKYKTNEFQNMPAQVMGSIRSLAAEIDGLISVPFAIASDLYNGLIEIITEISDLADTVISAVYDLFFGPKGVLDSILPMDLVNEFLEVVGELTSIIGGITQKIGGLDFISDINSQISGFASQADSIFSDPGALVQQYIPKDVSSTLISIRNPKQLMNNLIPDSISKQFQQLSTMPGLGFVGNLGYGLGGTLESLSKGILTQTLDSYTDQLGILSPSLNVLSKKNPVTDIKEPHPPQINSASTNPNIPTVQGVPVVLTPPPQVLPTKQSGSSVSPISQGQQNKNGNETINPGDKEFLDKLASGNEF
jgi:hypothetical protein